MISELIWCVKRACKSTTVFLTCFLLSMKYNYTRHFIGETIIRHQFYFCIIEVLHFFSWSVYNQTFYCLFPDDIRFSEVPTQLAFYVNLHRAVIGPSATLTGRWRPDIDLRRMLTGKRCAGEVAYEVVVSNSLGRITYVDIDHDLSNSNKQNTTS